MSRLASSMHGQLMAAIAGLLLFAAPMLPAVACCCVRPENKSLKSAATCCHRASRTNGDTANANKANANKANAKETTKPEDAASNVVKSCCKSRLTKSIPNGMAIESPDDPCECCISGDLPLSQGVMVESVHLKSVMSDWLLYLLPLPANRDNLNAMCASSEADVFRTHNQNQALLCVWRN